MYDLAFGEVQSTLLLMKVQQAWHTGYSAGAMKSDRAHRGWGKFLF